MTFSNQEFGVEVFQSAYRPYRRLPDLLDTLMRALVDRAQILNGSLSLREIGTLVLSRAGREITSDWSNDLTLVPQSAVHVNGGVRANAAGDAIRVAEWYLPESHDVLVETKGRARPVTSLAFPISYANAPIGEIRLNWQGDADGQEATSALFREFARQCGFLVKRYEVQRWSEQRLGRPLLLVGMSKALREPEEFLEKAARSELPVLVMGEFGTEKAQVAATIHCCGARREGPFVQVNCTEPTGKPADWFRQAKGGTLFLSEIDALAPHLQNQLPQHMHSGLGQWLDVSSAPEVRVVASTTADLQQRVREGIFSRALLAELDFLSVTVPPLRDRASDIEPLVIAALERNGFRADEKRTDDLIALCKAHSWPENIFELERVIARLAVMTDGCPIRCVDVRRHAPWLVAENFPLPVQDLTDSAVGEKCEEAPPLLLPDRWVHCAINKDPAELKKLHAGLKKALSFLGEHYAEPISLGQLAEQAHVSPSHLSFLFRSELETSFKTLLGRIRVEKAKEILSTDIRQPVTEVAMTVGFPDLSHFEKSFRRIVGQSPREFRRSLAGAKAQG